MRKHITQNGMITIIIKRKLYYCGAGTNSNIERISADVWCIFHFGIKIVFTVKILNGLVLGIIEIDCLFKLQ